eukprot:TRINITY_DN11435_c0_g1_i1.p1 TRINITY_DN11435_c0_g1~~TRINITY_DN11435_c0_g1_i1.p1  ORF type:complete len:366 (+),score=44.81 TRINITY_DN11435_c0_g1_i1:94-1191(+)
MATKHDAGQPHEKSTIRACLRCRLSKKSCDGERPCGRCIRADAENECLEAPKQKIGRKPKRQAIEAEAPAFGAITPNAGAAMSYDSLFPSDGQPFESSFAMFAGLLGLSTPAPSSVFAANTGTPPTAPTPVHVESGLISVPSWAATNVQAFIEDLLAAGRLLQSGQAPMPFGLYQFLCHLLFVQAECLGVDADRVQQLRDAMWGFNPIIDRMIRLQRAQRSLVVLPRPPPVISATASAAAPWTTTEHLPIGVIGLRSDLTAIYDLYINQAAADLFGYDLDYMYKVISRDCDGFILCHLAPESLSMFLSDVAAQKTLIRSPSRLFSANSTQRDVMVLSQFEYGTEGVPTMWAMYMTPLTDPVPIPL